MQIIYYNNLTLNLYDLVEFHLLICRNLELWRDIQDLDKINLRDRQIQYMRNMNMNMNININKK